MASDPNSIILHPSKRDICIPEYLLIVAIVLLMVHGLSRCAVDGLAPYPAQRIVAATCMGVIVLTAFLLTLSAALVITLALVIWSIKRHRDPDLHIECDYPIDKLVPSLAGLTLGTAVAGNTVEVFENGDFFDVLVEDIGAAKHSVHFETFLWEEGVLGQRVADVLAERARAGVQVRVLLDAIGSKKIGEAVERQMKGAGCKVVKFHHHHIRNIGVLHERDHRKLVVVDGKVAFVGGHCIKDEWLGDAQDRKHFADISVRVRGPIVSNVQSAFSENWGGETGELSWETMCFLTSTKQVASPFMRLLQSPNARRRQ